jgi:general secretion pathway protein K
LNIKRLACFQDRKGANLRQYQNGAALLAVLIVALVLVILMSVASQTMQSRLTLAENSKQQLLDHAQVQAKIAELTYLLATQRLTVVGVSQGDLEQGLLKNQDGRWLSPITGDEIRGDGKIYQEDSGIEYAVQNEAGLIPVNSREQFWLKLGLRGLGYSYAQQARYADTLADYADPDNWRRPAGAEKASYQSQGVTQPANFLLQSCSELARILTWSQLLDKHPELVKYCSLGRGGTINVNALPLELWAILWPNSLQHVMQQRENGKWFVLGADVLAIEPSFLPVSDELYSTLNGRTFTLRVSKHGVTSAFRLTRGNGKLKPYTLRKSF